MVEVRAGAEVASFPSARFYDNRKIMRKSINDNRKSRGRPATGTAPLVGVRMTEEFQAEINAWAKKQEDHPALATAIRRLVELGLTVRTPAKPVNKLGRRLRAKELAAIAIEKMIDPAAPPEERAQRRHRLTKGPSELRDDRVDLPKAKGK
jgi:hypothetical protein